jgi:hypothetical protein
MARLLLIAIASVCASCSTTRPAAVLMSEDSRIAIVVFQRLVKTHGYLGTPFICLSHNDPPADVFRELQGAVSVSIQLCSVARPGGVGYVDSATGKPGVILNLSAITRAFGNAVIVHAGYHCANLCAAEYEFEMGRSPLGEWKITKETMLWIS